MKEIWHKINLSKVQVAGNTIPILQDKLCVIYKLHNEPKDFACFFKAKNTQSSASIYISPLASVMCELVLNEHNATECDPPDYSSMGPFSGNKEFSL